MTTDFKIRDAIKLQIVQELIEPYYIHDIESKIRGKKCWKKTAQIFETVSKVLVAVGGIISFSSGYYKDETLSFFAGTISTLSLATLQFASFAYLENKKQGQELNVLLKKLDLDIVPIVEQQASQQNASIVEHEEHLPFFKKGGRGREKPVPTENKEEDSLTYLNHSTIEITANPPTSVAEPVPNLKEQ
jgi:hypothetical protein